MTAAFLLAALAAIASGGVLAAAPRTVTTGLTVQAAGAALLAVTGLAVLIGGTPIGAPFTSSLRPAFGVDPLSGLFLATLGLVAAAAALFSSSYLGRSGRDRSVAALTAAFVLVLAGVLCARDPITFLANWELMTLVPAAIILIWRNADRGARSTVFTYLAITHLGGAATWVAILLLADAGAIGNPSALQSGSGLQAAIAIAALVGMGTKAGAMPLHVWLPRAHPIAPAPVSALMSGVMIKVAIYGLVRVLLQWAGPLPLWIGVAVLAMGALSAVGGVVYALFQHDLKRLLAFHSIENIGIILLGLGASMVLHAQGADAAAALALAAALLHTLNHAIFKALLFLGAGTFERATGTVEIDRLGGLLRLMPWAGGAFLVGSMAIAGLPPLNGFASEWLTLRSLLAVPAGGGVADGIAGAAALAALASTAALAILCFVKVVGLVLLGPARRTAPTADAPPRMQSALTVLAAACVVLGVVPGLLLGSLVAITPGVASVPVEAGFSLPGTGSLPTLGITLVLVAGAGALVLARGRPQAAPAPTWACGQLVEPQLAWTSAGFTKPLRLVLEVVLRPRREIEVLERGGVVQRVSYHGEVPHLIEEGVYRPVTRAALGAAHRARRLQSGRLGTYVAYLVALIVVLLGAARLGVIG